jgi:phage tail protein X
MRLTTYTTKDGDTLDAICWKHYGQQSGAVEAVLSANPGLAAKGPIFEAGVTMVLPAIDTSGKTEGVSLWS